MRTIKREGACIIMITNITEKLHIEDPRNHPPEIVNSLRQLITAGVSPTPDPKRAHFFEVQHETLVYYVYISPASGSVMLLATWPA